jgi:subtilisin family serine protease
LIAQARLLGYVLMRIDNLGRLQETLIDLRIPADRSIPQAIDEIEALEPGVTAGANHAYTLQAQPPDLAYANAMIGWPTAGCAAHRRIGLIDAGVAQHHPALRSGTIIQAQMHLSDGVPRTRHGTLMADLLIGEGRLTGTTLYSANAVDPRQAAGDLAGVDAILRSVDWLAGSDVDLINISLAGPFNKLLNRGLGRASSDGIIFVAAAGNLGPTAPPQYPAAFPFVLAVTAVDRALSVYPRAVQGAHIDVAAPGVDILVRSGGRLRVTSGTSVAAPFVTAIIAADRDLRSARSREQVIARLAASAKDIGAVGKDSTFGIGMVQLPSSCAR